MEHWPVERNAFSCQGADRTPIPLADDLDIAPEVQETVTVYSLSRPLPRLPDIPSLKEIKEIEVLMEVEPCSGLSIDAVGAGLLNWTRPLPVTR